MAWIFNFFNKNASIFYKVKNENWTLSIDSFHAIPFSMPRPMEFSFSRVFPSSLGNSSFFQSTPAGLQAFTFTYVFSFIMNTLQLPWDLANIASSHPIFVSLQMTSLVAKTGRVQDAMWDMGIYF